MLVKPGVKRKKKTDICSVMPPQQEQYMISRYHSKINRYLHIQKCIWKSRYTNNLNANFFDNANYPHISETLIRPFNSNFNDADKYAVNIMRSYLTDIMDAHCLKVKFFTALRSSAEQAEAVLPEWIYTLNICM